MAQLDEQSNIQGVPAKCGHGGARPGAGRKPGSRFATARGDREYAKDLISRLMRDESQEAGLRARCALAVLSSVRRDDYHFDAPAGPPADPCGDDLAVPGELAGPALADAGPGGNPPGPGPS